MGSKPPNPHDPPMTTLHIQVPVTDVSAWKEGFAGLAGTRRDAGVRSEVVRRRVDDDKALVVDLEFDSTDAASSFLQFLRDNVWKDQPILAGPPTASILEPL